MDKLEPKEGSYNLLDFNFNRTSLNDHKDND
jgi:hypothetical protein